VLVFPHLFQEQIQQTMQQNLNSSTTTSIDVPANQQPNPGGISPLRFLGRGIAIVAVVVGTFILTKPSKSDYDVHIAETIVGELQQTYCQGVTLPKELNEFGSIAANWCKSGIAASSTAMGRDRLREYASNASTCKHYIVLSICTTEIPGKKITKLGLLRQFFLLPD
jgi:hypothetical protein